MSFGGFSDIQRDRDRAHSSRHRIAATRSEELGEESYESERRGSTPRSEERPNREGKDNEDSRRGGGTYGEPEEEQLGRGGGGSGGGGGDRRPYNAGTNDEGHGDTDSRGDEYGSRRSELRDSSENTDRGNSNGTNPINWESAVEAGISTFAKAYEKSASANKEGGTEANGSERRHGEPSAFGQRLAKREGDGGEGLVKQAFGGGVYLPRSQSFCC